MVPKRDQCLAIFEGAPVAFYYYSHRGDLPLDVEQAVRETLNDLRVHCKCVMAQPDSPTPKPGP